MVGVRVAETAEVDRISAVLRGEFAALDSRLEFEHVGSLLDRELNTIGGRQLKATRLVLSAASTAGLLLSLLGILGVVADGVTRRTRELGIRMALGATSPHLMKVVAIEGVSAGLLGLGLGVAFAFAAQAFIIRSMRSMGVRDIIADPLDPRVLAITGTIVIGATLLTSVVGARKATRLSPTEALRAD